jgi:hypothetical protein
MAMNEELIAQWEQEAFAASADLCAKVDGLVVSPIDLVTVPLEGAYGSNSADENYVNRLIERRHLTALFLSDQ